MHVSASRSPDRFIGEARMLFERILVLIDLTTQSSTRAAELAFELRRAFGSRVCLFQMPELSGGDDFLAGLGSPSVVGADLLEEAKGRLQRFVDNIAPEESGMVELRASMGVNAIETMKEEAVLWRASLVIAAADSHGGVFFLRSPAEKLVHDFDIPVLVLPAAAPER
jgi:nucleotide-binding universal stress UspA family protein